MVVFYTFLGGFSAVALTDFIQGTMMFFTVIYVPVAATIALGGPMPTLDILSKEGSDFFSFFPDSTGMSALLVMIVSSLGWGLGYFGQPHILVKFMAIGDPKELKKSTRIAMTWVLLSLSFAIAIGVVLVGCCPGGTASNVISYIAHADVALSVSMTMVNTILAPFVTPFLIWLIAGAWVDISFTAMMMSIIKMVLLPLLIGVGFNYFFPRQVAKVTKVMPMLSALVIIFTVGCVVSLSGRTILDNGLIILAVVILHNLGGMALGFFCAKKFGMTKAQIRAMSIEVGMQNSGLASTLALMYFTAAGGIAGAIFSVWHNVSGSLFASWCVGRDEEEMETKPAVQVQVK